MTDTEIWEGIRDEMMRRFANMAKVDPVAVALADQWLSAMREAAGDIGFTLDANAKRALVYLSWMVVSVCTSEMDDDGHTPPEFGGQMGGATLALGRALLGP